MDQLDRSSTKDTEVDETEMSKYLGGENEKIGREQGFYEDDDVSSSEDESKEI